MNERAFRKTELSKRDKKTSTFEKEDPAMHGTNTVDYAIVYEGEIWMELHNSETLHLRRGDVVVQNGTRHAWRNNGTKLATMLFS